APAQGVETPPPNTEITTGPADVYRKQPLVEPGTAAEGQDGTRGAILPTAVVLLPLRKISEAVDQSWNQLLKLTAPQLRGPESYETSKDMRAFAGKLARARDEFEA